MNVSRKRASIGDLSEFYLQKTNSESITEPFQAIGVHHTSDYILNRPLTPAPDIQNIISEIKNPSDLISAIEGYSARSRYINTWNLAKQENTKIKRYRNCLYFGQVVEGKRHGKGFLVTVNGTIYEGDWANEQKHGEGVEICPNGNKYEGSYVNGKPEGLGFFSWANGERYEGEWRNGMRHGAGTWHGLQGRVIAGEWRFGKADGKGVHIWRNGDHYQGEFKSCLKHGQGTTKFANGDLYVGNYTNGKAEGYGEYYWANGYQYKGHFKNGLKHGKGLWRKMPGSYDKYDGEWENDKKWGHGVYIYASGNIYKGNFFDDQRHGYGEMSWMDGSVYKGQWVRGVQNGKGELTVRKYHERESLPQQDPTSQELSDDDIRLLPNVSFENVLYRKESPSRVILDEPYVNRKVNLNNISLESTQRDAPRLHTGSEGRRTPVRVRPLTPPEDNKALEPAHDAISQESRRVTARGVNSMSVDNRAMFSDSEDWPKITAKSDSKFTRERLVPLPKKYQTANGFSGQKPEFIDPEKRYLLLSKETS